MRSRSGRADGRNWGPCDTPRQGGEKYNEAYFIYQELAQKHAVTVKLLNGQAICHMLQGKYTEAEELLMEALERVRSRPRVPKAGAQARRSEIRVCVTP